MSSKISREPRAGADRVRCPRSPVARGETGTRDFPMDILLDASRLVRPGEELNLDRLAAYLRQQLPDFTDSLAVEQFPNGYSNLTYLVRCGSREWVLRRPPFGNQVKTAHDMGREFRVLSAIFEFYPPAPVAHIFCADESVLGAPFYVMERRHGVVLRQSSAHAALLKPDVARRLGEAFIDNLARLHQIDYRAAGLGDFGRPEGYVERQVTGWVQRYRNAQTNDLPDLDATAAWLAEHRPAESGAALIHNDYKYDNLLLDPADLTRIVAVLDWEMATIGDPLADLGTSLGYWVEAEDSETFRAAAFGPTFVPESLTRRDLVERYAAATGCDLSGMLFYYVLGLFKIAVIGQQIYARFVRGHTKDERFGRLIHIIAILGGQAVRAMKAEHI
jgi:aminoglycoside phosphotransferase (APT) family kinase protein